MAFNFHPPLSSAPAVLLVVCVIVEIAGRFWRRSHLRSAALVIFAFAILAVPVTYVSGLLNEDLVAAAVQSKSHDAIEEHEDMGRLCLIFSVLPLLFRVLEGTSRKPSGKKLFSLLYLGSLMTLTGMIIYTSFLGGGLVFDHGAGVSEVK